MCLRDESYSVTSLPHSTRQVVSTGATVFTGERHEKGVIDGGGCAPTNREIYTNTYKSKFDFFRVHRQDDVSRRSRKNTFPLEASGNTMHFRRNLRCTFRNRKFHSKIMFIITLF